MKAFPDNPKVSIVTGTYNSAVFLPALFKSFQEQTHQNWEALFVDDGSPDNTVELIEAAAEKDERIKLFRKTPEGIPSRSRQVGIDNATGEIIAICDHDDLWAPEKLEFQLMAFRQHPGAAIVHTDREIIRTGQFPELVRFGRDKFAFETQSPRHVLYCGQRIINSSFITWTSLLREYGLHPDLKGIDDFFVFLKLAQRGEIVHVTVPLTYYRLHESNMSRDENILAGGLEQVADLLEEENSVPPLVQRAARSQALKTRAVTLLRSDPRKALGMLLKSIRLYSIPRAYFLAAFACLLACIPSSLTKSLVDSLRTLKARYPTIRDYLSSSS